MPEIDEKTLDRLSDVVKKVAEREDARIKRKGNHEFRALTPQQEEFCQIFVKSGGDAHRAWEGAGYSVRGKFWKVEASRMKSKHHILKRINDIRSEYVGEAGIDDSIVTGKQWKRANCD